jgi:ureidoglycolate hydrolase
VEERKNIEPIGLEQARFAPYGRVIVPLPDESPEMAEPDQFAFYVPFSERSKGWQIGYLVNLAGAIDKLERHPNTPELFSPLGGESVLVVAENPGHYESLRAFFLSGPIVLSRGVWHGVISTTERSEVLIVENPGVIDEYFSLPFTLTSI